MDGDAWSERGAERVAKRIRTYWTKRGRPDVRVWLEPITSSYVDEHSHRRGTITGYVIRSNMVGGQPRTPETMAEAA